MASLVSKVKGALMGLTIRKLFIGVAVLFGLKIVWHFLHPTPIDKTNLQEMADTPDYLLKQHGCTDGTHNNDYFVLFIDAKLLYNFLIRFCNVL